MQAAWGLQPGEPRGRRQPGPGHRGGGGGGLRDGSALALNEVGNGQKGSGGW